MTSIPDWIATGKCQTRDGEAVRIYATDAGGRWPIHGARRRADKERWAVMLWGADGVFPAWDAEGNLYTAKSDSDLIPIPQEPTATTEDLLVSANPTAKDIAREPLDHTTQVLIGVETTRCPKGRLLSVRWEAG